jgi:hypothetical protein
VLEHDVCASRPGELNEEAADTAARSDDEHSVVSGRLECVECSERSQRRHWRRSDHRQIDCYRRTGDRVLWDDEVVSPAPVVHRRVRVLDEPEHRIAGLVPSDA